MQPKDYYRNVNARTADWNEVCPTSSHETGIDFMIRLIEQLSVNGGRFLDIGCQAGHLVNVVKARFSESVGVDIGDYGEYWKIIDGANFFTHDLDSASLPFPADYFDIVTCFMVLEHVFDVFGVVEEIARITKPGKYVVLEVPNVAYVKHIFELMKGSVPRTGAQKYPFARSDGWDGQHLHYFTLREITWLCHEFGLTVVKHASRGKHERLRSLCPSLLYASIALTLRKNPPTRC